MSQSTRRKASLAVYTQALIQLPPFNWADRSPTDCPFSRSDRYSARRKVVPSGASEIGVGLAVGVEISVGAAVGFGVVVGAAVGFRVVVGAVVGFRVVVGAVVSDAVRDDPCCSVGSPAVFKLIRAAGSVALRSKAQAVHPASIRIMAKIRTVHHAFQAFNSLSS